ncbi:DNA primase, partial [Mobiluncus curtisii]|nr:DNA primase [Mobiluncus curtisii]
TITNADEYAGLKHRLASRFGFFDRNALDAGRFIYGASNAVVTAHEGDQLLDAWLDAADEIDVFAAFDASTLVIGEGSRNATLSRFAGRVLIRYGQTDQARDLFDRKANLCEP